jgi:AAA family ATP:ADP antiporter
MPAMALDPMLKTSEVRTLTTHPELKSQQSVPFFKTVGEAPKNALERFLSLFADVRAGEGAAVILMTVTVFLLLAAYYLLKVAREQLIVTEAGAVVKVQAAAAQAVLLLGVVPLFGWLASRVKRIRLITITSLFFAANLLMFYALGRAGVREGVVFYIWLGIFNLFVVSQFWAFANDFYTEGQGRRLFPMIGVGASLGAWVGSTSVEPLIKSLGVTPYTQMLMGSVLLVLALLATRVVNSRQRDAKEPEAAAIEAAPLGKEGGFELVMRDPYLRWIAVFTILLNVVNTTGEFLLTSLVQQQSQAVPVAEQKAFVGAFYGSFYGWVNLAGFLMQLLLASRVMRVLGVRGSLFIMPIVALVNYSMIAVVPILAVVRIGKILENSTDYSIQNTVRQALFLPTTREAKYKAKAAIDTFCTRLGDVTAAAVVTVGTLPMIGMGISGFGWVNVVFTVGFIYVAMRIAREHRRKTV